MTEMERMERGNRAMTNSKPQYGTCKWNNEHDSKWVWMYYDTCADSYLWFNHHYRAFEAKYEYACEAHKSFGFRGMTYYGAK